MDNEKKLTREYINIYYNKNQPQAAPKCGLKLSSRKFFSSAHSTRDRTYSDNATCGLPGLDTNPKATLKNSESSDKLKKALEEEKVFKPIKDAFLKKAEAGGSEDSDEVVVRKAEARRMLERAPEPIFREVPKAKKNPTKKNKKGKRRPKKNKDFHNWTYVGK